MRTLILLTAFLIISGTSAAPPGERYIIQFEAGRADAGRSAVARAGTIVRDLASYNAVAAVLPEAALSGLARSPGVAYVEVDPRRYLLSHSSAGEEVPYGIPLVQADLVSDANAGNRTVCVIDTGYDLNHPDLPNGVNVTGTSDPAGTGDWFEDGDGHGTHVSGTIAAIGGNGIGVVGVLPSGFVNLHIVRVYGDDGEWAYSSDLVAALDVCRTVGANVINMSLGGDRKSRLEQRAFDVASQAGVLSVAAAGNDGNTRHLYPASYDSVISVGAVDENVQVASFSQQTSQVELVAPGVGVLSTVPYAVGRHSDVTVGIGNYDSIAMDGSALGSGAGPLVDCGLARSTCTGSVGAVCLIERGSITFADKVTACEAGGGVAAIIYNNEPGSFSGTLGGITTTIFSVGISQSDGATLLSRLGDTATVSVTSTNYAAFDGTSMATPHASGVAALVWSHHPSCSNEEIRNVLAETALDLGEPGRDSATGFGLVQASDALSSLDANGCAGGGTGCQLKAKGEACSSNSECCSNKCKGKSGAMTCK
jgi:subtilisin family serine protease